MEAASNKPLCGVRVLVVEDNAFVAMDIVDLLRKAGAETLGPARSLARAVKLAAAETLDCAVLDVILHDALVFPAASILRKKGAGIVFYTGYNDLEGLERNWPAAQILIKPASPNLLVQTVRAACSV